MEAGASERLEESDAQKKKHPYDFALWKGAKPGEPSWPSPWGLGRPGWHIECSAMSMRYLGQTFDLHGGGLDLVFPHHENEIAQSECATGQCYARHWMHNGFVQVNREKMSKSLGNFFRLREAFAHTEPEAVRYSLLTAHYRAPYNLEVDLDDAGHLLGFPQFREAEQRLEYLYATKQRLEGFDPQRIDAASAPRPTPAELAEFATRLGESLDDDLNTAQGLAHVAALLKSVNELLDQASVKKGKLASAHREAAVAAFERLGAVLGLGLDQPSAFATRVRDRRAQQLGIDQAWVEGKLVERGEARAAKDFARADAIRGELAERGVEMFDTPEGTSWRLLAR
ncbi:MAG TPA: DALR domain-containing protein, partial [Polyangiaceae bacterium]|nr:DALR domain-containing protein [Polyangiaceae bacterium]